ncbi:MAG: indole-3-glycerol phosphate synthase TrpC [Acidobacteria bacterium]|nr:indole-3-glycerol phosphate synthase TrpC [Acidobacteriota bacterium]MYJ03711.1 indole-3-glycerol phosphate synthase TrpC [Acidobacteriota bacterium]
MTYRPDLLETIVAATRRDLSDRTRSDPAARGKGAARGHQPRGQVFIETLRETGRCRVIAECKRRSPSRGVIRKDYDPAAIASSYADAGAAAISVLTERGFFDGALEHLAAVRREVSLPLLRKDFIIDRRQLTDAAEAGADAVLLIVAALDDRNLRDLTDAASELGLATLTEVHDRRELDRALDAGADIVGVNNRNLRTLEVDLDASRTLIEAIPEDVVAVAESGLRTATDLAGLRRAGYDAFLIGESLMQEPDPGASLGSLLNETGEIPRGRRPAAARIQATA